MWVDLSWEGIQEGYPYRLPDGREYNDVIQAGEFAQIVDQVWLTVTNSGKPGDMLWSTGGALTVVSRRMAEVLVAAEPGNLEMFPVTIRRRRSPDLEDYVLLVGTGESIARRVREFPLGHRATRWLDVDPAVLTELRRLGFTGFDVEDARQLAEDIAAAQTAPEPAIHRSLMWWASEITGDGTLLRLRVDEAVEETLFTVPEEVLPPGFVRGDVTVNGDDSASAIAPDGTGRVTFSRPVAIDASGGAVGCFWVEDDGALLLNVDHFPGITSYPVDIHAAVGGLSSS